MSSGTTPVLRPADVGEVARRPWTPTARSESRARVPRAVGRAAGPVDACSSHRAQPGDRANPGDMTVSGRGTPLAACSTSWPGTGKRCGGCILDRRRRHGRRTVRDRRRRTGCARYGPRDL